MWPFISPCLGDEAGYGVGLSYRPDSLCTPDAIAGFTPRQGTKNATSLIRNQKGRNFNDIFDNPVYGINWKQLPAKKILISNYLLDKFPIRNPLFFDTIAHPVDDPAVHVTVRPPVDCILQPTNR
jgi:hypothetical protein